MDTTLEKLTRSLDAKNGSSNQQLAQCRQTCILTLLRVLDNILSDPQRSNTKTRKIKVDNAVFWKRAGQWDGSIDFLVVCGFSALGTSVHGNGVPQHLKLDTEDDGRREVLLRGRESLTQFAVQILSIDKKLLPPCPVQSQSNNDSGAIQSKCSQENDDDKKDSISHANAPNSDPTAHFNNIQKIDFPNKKERSSNFAGEKATKSAALLHNVSCHSLPSKEHSIINSEIDANDHAHVPVSTTFNSIGTKNSKIPIPLTKPSDSINPAPTQMLQSANLTAQEMVSITQNQTPEIDGSSDNAAILTSPILEKTQSQLQASSATMTPAAPQDVPTRTLENAHDQENQSHLSKQCTQTNGDVQLNGKDPNPSEPSNTDAQPDEMADLLDEIEFELNIDGDLSEETNEDEDQNFIANSSPLISKEHTFIERKDENTEEAIVQNEPKKTQQTSLDNHPDSENKNKLVVPANHGTCDPKFHADSDKIHDHNGLNGSNEHIQLSQSVKDLLEPTVQNTPPTSKKSGSNPGKPVDSFGCDNNNTSLSGAIATMSINGETPDPKPCSETSVAEVDVANLLDDLESDANYFSSEVQVDPQQKSPVNKSTIIEQYRDEVLAQEGKVDANCGISEDDHNGKQLKENNTCIQNNSNGTDGVSFDQSPPPPNEPPKLNNVAYFDLLRKIPLPEGELVSSEVEDGVTFRLGFELCHRALFSIWPITDAVIQSEKSNSKNPDNAVWLSLLSSDISTGLSNLNLWKEFSEDEDVVSCSETPQNERAISGEQLNDNDVGKSQSSTEPLVLVPLVFVYKAWACILGLKSSHAKQIPEIGDAGARSGKMYSWILSNHSELATLGDVPIDMPSLNYDSNLSESSIAVCNYVASVLRNIGLISLYGADVTVGTVSPSSELAFYVGIERRVFKEIIENASLITLEDPVILECHRVLAQTIYPRFMEFLDDKNNSELSKMDDRRQSLFWYSCRHSIHHLLASGQFDESQLLLLDDRFIRARLQSTGLLRGAFDHSCDCAKMTSCLSNLFDTWQSNQLQNADTRNRENRGVSSFSLEDYDNKESVTSGAPDLSTWKNNYFKALCTISTVLRESAGELSIPVCDASANVGSYSGGEYQRRCLKEEIGSAFQMIGESIGDIDSDVYRTEEMENYEEALQLKTEAFGDKQNDASIADTLYAMGCHHQRFSHFTFAQKCYEQALRIYKATLGFDHICVARVLHNIGIMYASRTENDTAMKCFKKSLSIRISELGNVDLSVADSLCWIGKMHRENEELFDARECFMLAHRTKATILGKQHPECADVLHNIGVVCDDLSLYPQSLSCYREAMMIRRSNISGLYDVSGISDVCDTLNCIANVYRITGERQKALQFYQQSLKRRVRIVSAMLSDREQASMLLRTYEDVIALLKIEVKECSEKSEMRDQIGKLLLEMGKLYENRLDRQSKAMMYYQKALEVFKQMKNYKLIGDTLSFMGVIHVKRDSNQKALKCFRDSLVLRKMSSKEETADTAETYHNIGNCEAKLGLFEDCLHSYCEALKIKKKLFPQDCLSLSTAKTEHCMGLVLLQLGSVEEALGFFIPSMEVRQSILGSDHLDYSFSLHNVGKVYFHQGKFDDAVVLLEEALRIKKSKLSERHQSLAETEHVLASLYIKKEDFAAAIPLLKSALTTYKSKKDCDIMKSDVLDLLGNAYALSGIHEDAILSYKHSLKIKRAICGLDNIACANVLMEIGKLRAGTGDLNEALVAFKEVKRIQKKIYGTDNLKNAELLIQVGSIQLLLNNNDMAFKCFTEGLRVRKMFLDENDSNIAEAMTLVGRVHQGKDEHFKSISFFQDAITIYRNPTNNNMVQECANVCRLLGISQMKIGDHENALSSLDRCLKLRESVCGSDSEEWAEIAYTLGVANAQVGLYDEAVALLEKFVLLKRKPGSVDSENLSNALFQLGLIQSKNRSVDEALELFEEALSIRRKLDDNDLGVSEVLFQIGSIRETKKQFLESLVSFQESLRLRQFILGKDEVTADIMLRIGEVHRLRQEFDLAVEMLTTALNTYKETVGEDHLSVASTLHSLGYVCDAKHDAREAMKYHKEGLNVRKLNLGSNHVNVAASLDDIAGIYQKVGENERALKCLTESLRIRKLHLGSDSMEIATNLFGMGIVFAALSNNEKAMECYNASLDISACDGSNPKLEAQTLHQIGCVHAAQCNYRDALQNWRTSLSKYRDAGMVDDHYMVACTLGNIEMAENVLAGN